MHLKESAYNFIYDDLGKDQIVFYNSRTGALAVVHEDQYKQYKGFQEKGKEIEDAEFLKNLLKCGYLLPAEVDEKFLIKTNMMQGLPDRLKVFGDAILSFACVGAERTMNLFNKK